MAKRSYDEVTNGKSRGNGPSTKPERTEQPFTYININLSESDKEKLKSADFDGIRFLDWVVGLVSDGYKISVNFDSNSDCYIVSVTSSRKTNGDYNRCVTSRATGFEKACLTAIYKFEVLLMGGAIPAPVDVVRGDVWD